MAESIVSDLVVKLLEYLGKSTSKNIAPYFGGRHKLLELEQTMEMIQARLFDAEKRGDGQGADILVKNWLKKLKHVLHQIQDLLEEATMARKKEEQLSGCVGNLTKLFHVMKINKKLIIEGKVIMKELKNITSLMDSLKFREVHNQEQFSVTPADPTSDRETHSFVVEEHVIGRDEDKRKILQWVLDPNNHGGKNPSVIPIVGMAGLGKTTLAQLVYNDLDVEEQFELRSWVCVLDISSLKNLAGKILASIASDISYSHLSMDQIQSQLHNVICGKKYLFVLDDIWDEDLSRWLELRNLLRGGKQGSKIIVTTRSQVVGTNTGTIQAYELQGLPPEKSWEMFRKLAFEEGQEEIKPNLKSIGKDIVKKCGNVPLAIKTIACLLFSMDTEKEWECFRDKEMRMVDQDRNNILSTLKLSYNQLPPPLKQCFAYCSLFPKDYRFSKQDLIYLWMAQGFIRSSNENNESEEDIGHGYFMQLRRRCFFQEVSDEDGEIIICCMHDLVHELAQLVAGDETLIVDGVTQEINYKPWHVSVNFPNDSSEEFPSQLFAANKMRTLILLSQTSKVNLDEACLSLRYLRALDLAKLKCVKLPNSLVELKHLRYLKLGSHPEFLPDSITKLENLQTLDLRECFVKYFPRTIPKWLNLRHFIIRQFKADLPPGFGQLTSLQTLGKFTVGEGNGLDVLANLNSLVGELTINFAKCRRNSTSEAARANLKAKKLSALSLFWRTSYAEQDGYDYEIENEVLKYLQLPPSLKQLQVTKWRGIRFPNWDMDEIPCLLSNLVNICIEKCCQCQHLPPFCRLPHLKTLSLLDLEALEYIEIGRDDSDCQVYFPSLQALCLGKLLELKGWSNVVEDDDQESPHFPSLSELRIYDCPKLESMPLAPRLESLDVDSIQKKLLKHFLHEEEESVLAQGFV